MTYRYHAALRRAAHELGFTVAAIRGYLRKVPGSPTNEQWFHVRLWCPCAAEKHIHVREESMCYLPGTLRDHLIRDGLLDQRAEA